MIPGVGRGSLFVVKALKLLTTARKIGLFTTKKSMEENISKNIAALKNRFSHCNFQGVIITPLVGLI